MTPSDRLLVRLRREFPQIAALKNARIIRTRAGKWQRAAGAWRWQIHADTLYPGFGSQYTVKQCLAAKKLTLDCNDPPWASQSDFHIDVADKPAGDGGRAR